MLVEFSVENFYSIKERITFSMEATSDKEHKDNIIKIRGKDDQYLRAAAIYGANASGKSNFINALETVATFVKISHQFTPDRKINIVPFKLDANTENEPTIVEIIFINNKIKYRYGFSLTVDRIINEYLYSYETRKPKCIFERKGTTEYRFTKDKKIQEDISKKTNDHALYLTTSAQWNYKPSIKAMDWFNDNLVIGTSSVLPFWKERTCELILENPEMKAKILESIRSADLGIFAIEVSEKEDRTVDKDMALLLKTFIQANKTYDINIGHIGKKGNVDTTVHLNFDDESGGTKKLFTMIGPLLEALSDGSTVLFDEFDTNIHPLLLRNIIEMFQDPSINKKGAQLIFTTHATSLLDSEMFRRDQIWFTEKRLDGSTDLFCLSDFDVRKDANFEKGYLQGRYGAIPFLTSESLL